MNVANKHKKSTRFGMIGWEWWSTGNCARVKNFTILQNAQPESIWENEMLKILWDFEIQTDHLIPARRPDLGLINKKKKELTI